MYCLFAQVDEPTAQENHDNITYQIKFEQTLPKNIIQEFRKNSLLFKTNKSYSTTSLKNRFYQDKKVLKKVLASYGYCQAKIKLKITKEQNTYILLIKIDLRKQYTISKIIMQHEDIDIQTQNILLGFKVGDVFNANTMLAGINRLLTYYKEHGYPFVSSDTPEITLDEENSTLEININVTNNGKKKFGAINYVNFKKIKTDFVKHKIEWSENDTFQESLLEKTRKKLTDSGIIGYASIKPIKTDDEHVPIRIKIYEAAPRTLSLEGLFSTSESFGGRVKWEHKNLWGMGESISFALKFSRIFSYFESTYKIPYFRNSASIGWFNSVMLIKENLSAYSGLRQNAQTGFEKRFNDELSAKFAIKYENVSLNKGFEEYDQRNDAFVYKNYYRFKGGIISFPMSITYDNTDDLINPTRGQVAQLSTEFYTYNSPKRIVLLAGDKEGESEKLDNTMVSTRFEISHLQPLKKDGLGQVKYGWYNQIMLGNIFKSDVNKIMPHDRFYMGGVKDMRAYGHQLVGTLDDAGRPTGGLSYALWTSEFRTKITEQYGVNIFYETGFVSNRSLWHKSDKEIFHSVGSAFLYYSQIGPIQVGIGFPLKRRKNMRGKFVDSLFHFYVNIGQTR